MKDLARPLHATQLKVQGTALATLQQGLHVLLRTHEVAAARVHHGTTATSAGVDDLPPARPKSP